MYSDRQFRQFVWTLFICSFGVSIQARSWRLDQVPNGNVFKCQTCHLSANGGGTRNAFGTAVFSIVRGGSFAEFWSPALAALDSDRDGFTNGEELGDPDGDGIPIAGATVTNPGSATSKPAVQNTPPTIGSTPITSAFFGAPYQYQITAQDLEGNSLTYSKTSGPDWLSVSPAGLVSGIPPENAAEEFTISIRATDNGSPAMSATQTYELHLNASFTGWQNLRFNGAVLSPDAAQGADPDGDGLSNIAEYLLKSDPHTANSGSFVAVEFNSSGQLTLRVKVRDDDPNVAVHAVFADSVEFATSTAVSADERDDSGEGFKTLIMSDTVSRSQQSMRFARILVVP